MLGQDYQLNEMNKIVRYYYDSKEDYRLAAKRAYEPEMRDQLMNDCFQREQYHFQLQEMESRLGVEVSDNGTVWADFVRDWERVRGAVIGHGLEAALKLARVSDTHALRQIETVLEMKLVEPLDSLLRQHMGEIQSALLRLETHLSVQPKTLI